MFWSQAWPFLTRTKCVIVMLYFEKKKRLLVLWEEVVYWTSFSILRPLCVCFTISKTFYWTYGKGEHLFVVPVCYPCHLWGWRNWSALPFLRLHSPFLCRVTVDEWWRKQRSRARVDQAVGGWASPATVSDALGAVFQMWKWKRNPESWIPANAIECRLRSEKVPLGSSLMKSFMRRARQI